MPKNDFGDLDRVFSVIMLCPDKQNQLLEISLPGWSMDQDICIMEVLYCASLSFYRS